MWPAVIGAVGSLASVGLSNALSRSNANTSFKHQKDLMALQQQYAVDNWTRENNYNRPEEQMKRLKDAGLNPDLIYGNGAAGLQAGPTAAPTAPSAPMAQTVSMSNPIAEGAQAALAINQAKKAKAEGVGQTIENEFNQKTLEDRIKSIALQNGWTKQQTDKALEETQNLQQQYGVLVAQQNLLSTDRQIRDKELAAFDEEFSKRMREYNDRHNLSKEEYRRLRDTYDDFVRTIKASADESEWKAKMSELLYSVESNWKDTEKKLGALGTLLRILKMALK